MNIRRVAMVLLGGLLLLGACSSDGSDDAVPPGNLLATVASSSNHKTLLAAIRQAGLSSTLQTGGPYTLFAPTDAAFAALPPGVERQLFAPENRDQLAQVVRYHIVPARLTSSDLEGEISTPTTLEGRPLQIDGIGAEIEVDEVEIIVPDVEAANGIIQVIDGVLLPQ
ncbi:MAG: fasciclin domain-containing protein [Pseudomonadota bacterium]